MPQVPILPVLYPQEDQEIFQSLLLNCFFLQYDRPKLSLIHISIVAASGAQESICPECGNPMQGDEVKKLLGGHAVCMHSACAQALINNVKAEEEEFKNSESNAGKGLLRCV